jgi:hypothetical protein
MSGVAMNGSSGQVAMDGSSGAPALAGGSTAAISDSVGSGGEPGLLELLTRLGERRVKSRGKDLGPVME